MQYTTQYFVKIHVPTGLIQGYLESESLKKLEAAYRKKSDEICDICLMEGGRYDSERINVSISPQQIIAIESKFVR